MFESMKKSRVEQIIESECSCHLNPPCSWCELLTEEEFSMYGKHGRDGLIKWLREKSEADEFGYFDEAPEVKDE